MDKNSRQCSRLHLKKGARTYGETKIGLKCIRSTKSRFSFKTRKRVAISVVILFFFLYKFFIAVITVQWPVIIWIRNWLLLAGDGIGKRTGFVLVVKWLAICDYTSDLQLNLPFNSNTNGCQVFCCFISKWCNKLVENIPLPW